MNRRQRRAAVADYLTVATALSYRGNGAPRVVASGRDQLAERILAVAREHELPVVESPELAALLAQVPLESEIPRELYVAVAEILAFAYSLRPDRDPTQNANDAAVPTAETSRP